MTCVVGLGSTNNQAYVFNESGDMSEETFQFLTILLCLLVILELIFKFQMVLPPDIYPFDLFHIECLILHWHLNDIFI